MYKRKEGKEVGQGRDRGDKDKRETERGTEKASEAGVETENTGKRHG